jgi:hypothetical protein
MTYLKLGSKMQANLVFFGLELCGEKSFHGFFSLDSYHNSAIPGWFYYFPHYGYENYFRTGKITA